MRFIPPALVLSALLLVAAAVLWQTGAGADGCDDVRTLMPPEFASFEETSCETDELTQARAQLTLTVPADQVVALARRLTDEYGMGEMTFVCCGHEPKGGRRGGVDVPDGIIAPPPPGAITEFTITLDAPGLREDESCGPPPVTEFHGLGDQPATLTLGIVDV